MQTKKHQSGSDASKNLFAQTTMNTNSKINEKELVQEIYKLGEKHKINIYDYIALEIPQYFYKLEKELPREIEIELDILFSRLEVIR